MRAIIKQYLVENCNQQYYEYISAPYKTDLKEDLNKKNTEHRANLDQILHNFTKTIWYTLECRDSYTAGHQKRVAELAHLIGKRIGLGKDLLQELYVGGILHDIGKIGVSMEILTKSTCLSDMEFLQVKKHTQIGFGILKEFNFPWSIRNIALNHHEKLDGSGYPNGISGDKISYSVRIITVCDVVEAMSTMRPYRAARTSMEVIDELRMGKGVKYDKEIVDAMIDLIESKVYNPWRVSTTM